MVEDGDIKPIVDLIYSFDDGIDAYEYLATGRAQGKNYKLILNSLKSELTLKLFVAK
jgi:hypothetical protein